MLLKPSRYRDIIMKGVIVFLFHLLKSCQIEVCNTRPIKMLTAVGLVPTENNVQNLSYNPVWGLTSTHFS